MAAIDLQTLRSDIRFRGDYQNVRKFPNASVDKEIQRSFGEFYALVDSTHEGYWDTDDTVTTVADQRYVALPASCWRVKGVDRLDGSDYIELRQVSVSDRNKFNSSSDTPQAYRLTARGIELYPTPETAYTLRVTFTPVAPALEEAAEREWYNGWEEYVIESTLMKLDRREGKPLGEREREIARLEKRIKEEATERKQQEPEYLVLREGGDMERFPFGEPD